MAPAPGRSGGRVADGTVSGPARSRRSRTRSRPATAIDAIVESVGGCGRSPTPGSLGAVVDGCIAEHADVVREVPRRQGERDRLPGRTGDEASGGSANPKLAQELLRERLLGVGARRCVVDPEADRPAVPFWQLALCAALLGSCEPSRERTHPLRRMWRSQNAIDRVRALPPDERGRRHAARDLARRLDLLLPAGRTRRSGESSPTWSSRCCRSRSPARS